MILEFDFVSIQTKVDYLNKFIVSTESEEDSYKKLQLQQKDLNYYSHYVMMWIN